MTKFIHSIGIVGATGAVGKTILKVLEERQCRPATLRLFASQKSAGTKISFRNNDIVVEDLAKADFSGLDVVFFSAGTNVSLEYCKKAVTAGAIVIDNTNAHRMCDEIPLVIPEVNPEALRKHNGLIANPNCSTIQMLVAIAPIHRVNPIKRVVVSTYQSVSGTGLKAVEALKQQCKDFLDNKEILAGVYSQQIGFNLFPHIDIFLESGLCREEEKMIKETHKILDEAIAVCPTTVRVPIISCHSESINLQLTSPMKRQEAVKILEKAEDIKIIDDLKNNQYPTPLSCEGKDEVFVGRIREDASIENGINMWVVADNLRRGAATNAVKIYFKLVEYGLI